MIYRVPDSTWLGFPFVRLLWSHTITTQNWTIILLVNLVNIIMLVSYFLNFWTIGNKDYIYYEWLINRKLYLTDDYI